MIYQLKKPQVNQFPHGGWPFRDERTGFTCKPHEGTPAMHAVKIIAHRRANPQHYPRNESKWFDQASVIQEVYAQKAKTHPQLFIGFPDAVIVPRAEIVINPGRGPQSECSCGAKTFEPIYCKTCAGKRVTGYKCKNCGKEVKR